MRRAFKEGEGLVLTASGWRAPGEVLAGPPVFGGHMPFAPQIDGTDPLWEALRLRQPSLNDCLRVLRGLARAGRDLNVDDEGVQLETFRLVVELAREAEGRDVRRKLGKLPLWTTQGWKKERPFSRPTTKHWAMPSATVSRYGNRVASWSSSGLCSSL